MKKSSEKYNLIYTRNALRDIKRLDSVAKKRIGKKLKIFSSDPLKYSTKLTANAIGDYRWRIGNYRIIFNINKKRLEILRIRHRRDVYK